MDNVQPVKLTGSIRAKVKLTGILSKPEIVDISEVGQKYYEGPYEVIPDVTDQILSTSKKVMTEDVIVHGIPKQYGLVTYDQDKRIIIT